MFPEAFTLRERKERLAAAIREKRAREARKAQSNPNGGLIEFIRYFWHVLEPVDPFVEGWTLECLCAHLEAITRGETVEISGNERPFNRFLGNVPPGFMKSLTVQVFWKAWEWGAMKMPHLRYVSFSYSPTLTERDNGKLRDLICSESYQELWGHVFRIVGDGKVMITNDKTGSSLASSFGSVGTGIRGHRVILDDPHKLRGTQETTEARASVTTWVREAMQNRLNDLRRDVIVVIMQRLYEDDAAGSIMEHLADEYCHLIIPMEYEGDRHFSHYMGWNDGQDPRTKEGQLAWPERFPATSLASFKRNNYLWAGQYQQRPVPRGGGLFKDDWWQVHEVVRSKETGQLKFVPGFTPLFVVAGLDTAFSEKEENDYSALVVWAVYEDNKTGHRRIMLVDAWMKQLSELHGVTLEKRDGESEAAYIRRSMPKWGLVEWVAHTCTKRKVDRLLVENKARGHDVVKEIKRLHASRDWSVRPVEPKGGDKWTRAHSVVDLFTDEMIFAPAEIREDGTVEFLEWAQMTMKEFGSFPKGAHDDIIDAGVMGLKHLREIGMAVRKDEARFEAEQKAQHRGQSSALYPV